MDQLFKEQILSFKSGPYMEGFRCKIDKRYGGILTPQEYLFTCIWLILIGNIEILLKWSGTIFLKKIYT